MILDAILTIAAAIAALVVIVAFLLLVAEVLLPGLEDRDDERRRK